MYNRHETRDCEIARLRDFLTTDHSKLLTIRRLSCITSMI